MGQFTSGVIYVQSELAAAQFLHLCPAEASAPSPDKASIKESHKKKYRTYSALGLMHRVKTKGNDHDVPFFRLH